MLGKLITLTVETDCESTRIDKYISNHPEIKTRSRADFLINKNLVKVNNKTVKASYKIKPLDEIQIQLPEESDSDKLEKLDLKLDVIFEDKDVIVVNKPSGIVVHPAAGHANDTLVNALVNHTDDLSMKFGEDRPGIVHRLDKETSGILVVAKNDESHLSLAQQFKERTIERTYEAIVIGSLNPEAGKIISYLARHPVDRKKYSSIRDSKKKIIRTQLNDPITGKLAITNFKNLISKNNLSLVELHLETGRTHQIRVHLSELGYPILSDFVYGAKSKEKCLKLELIKELKSFNRFFLHAKSLGFTHPKTKKFLQFEVEWPELEKKFIKTWLLS
ncbi:MAG: RluA family pseudouridine synthase [Bdellovibrionales bacterium]|nr:RluA family pseudouridine synthase [Bdellovibrionales bacterium]